MKQLYWSGDAVINLFLGKDSSFLLPLAAKGPVVYTSASSRGEFQLAVVQAHAANRISDKGATKLRSAFEDAVENGILVLINGSAAPPDDFLQMAEIFPLIHTLTPSTVAHMSLAKQQHFRRFICTDSAAAAVCEAWGLRPIVPPISRQTTASPLHPAGKQEEEAAIISPAGLPSYYHSISEFEKTAMLFGKIRLMCDLLQDLRPDIKCHDGEEAKAIEDFFATILDVESSLQEADEELACWDEIHERKAP